MRTFFGDSAHDPAAIAIVGALALLSVGVSSGHGAGVLAILLAAVTLLAVAHRSILKWDRMVTALLIVVLFVPIGRFKLPAVLPFDLELYRIVVAILLLLWLTTLLIDSRVQLQRTPFDRPYVPSNTEMIISGELWYEKRKNRWDMIEEVVVRS